VCIWVVPTCMHLDFSMNLYVPNVIPIFSTSKSLHLPMWRILEQKKSMWMTASKKILSFPSFINN
jgi:hypothetical protein